MEAENEKKQSPVSDVGAWAMNVVSSVGIIMANKQLMSSSGYAFGFATTLTGFHFAVTALVGLVSNATGLSASKHVPFWELLWFSIVANTSIIGMNFSLKAESIWVFQKPRPNLGFFDTQIRNLGFFDEGEEDEEREMKEVRGRRRKKKK